MNGCIFDQVTIERLGSSDASIPASSRAFNINYKHHTFTEDILLGLLTQLVAQWRHAAVPYDYETLKSAVLEVVDVMYGMQARHLSPAWKLTRHDHFEEDAVCAVTTPLTGRASGLVTQTWSIQLVEGSGREAVLTITATTLPQLLAGVIHAYTSVYVPEVSQAFTDALPDDELILDILADGVRDLPGRLFTGEL